MAALAELVRDLVILGLGLGVAFAMVCLVLSVVVYRRVRRAAPLKRTRLAVRSTALPPGPARTLAQQRRLLDRSVRSTRECVERARSRGQRVNDLPHSVTQLAAAARLLDDHLRDLESEVDPVRQAVQLPAAGERVRQLTGAAATVREAVCATTVVLSDLELRSLAAEVDREALRLSTYGAAYRELREGVPEPALPLAGRRR